MRPVGTESTVPLPVPDVVTVRVCFSVQTPPKQPAGARHVAVGVPPCTMWLADNRQGTLHRSRPHSRSRSSRHRYKWAPHTSWRHSSHWRSPRADPARCAVAAHPADSAPHSRSRSPRHCSRHRHSSVARIGPPCTPANRSRPPPSKARHRRTGRRPSRRSPSRTRHHRRCHRCTSGSCTPPQDKSRVRRNRWERHTRSPTGSQPNNYPPQSTANSSPFATPSTQVGTWQICAAHTALAQSIGPTQAEPLAHALQLPPQSTSLSSPLATSSMQCKGVSGAMGKHASAATSPSKSSQRASSGQSRSARHSAWHSPLRQASGLKHSEEYPQVSSSPPSESSRRGESAGSDSPSASPHVPLRHSCPEAHAPSAVHPSRQAPSRAQQQARRALRDRLAFRLVGQ